MTKIESLKELMQTCVEAGYLRGQQALLPSTDKVRKKDAEALLARYGLQKSLLQRWIDGGMITAHKGEKNSPIWFSRLELIEMVGVIQYDKVINS